MAAPNLRNGIAMARALPTALAALLYLALATPARAGLLVLVHGYAGDPSSWDRSGVTAALEARGYGRGGVLAAAPGGAVLQPAPGTGAAAGGNTYYLAALPAQAPVMVQAAHLAAELALLRRLAPDLPLALAGHSAGGVVARSVLLGGNPWRVSTLITIASPHLGTARALQGLDAVEAKPFFCPGPGIDFLKNMVGGPAYDYLEHSRGLLLDLAPAAPGSFLDWLARQPHPDIRYVAVVRSGPAWPGDILVPAWSQDLNHVPALHGAASVVHTTAAHGLVPADGALLADLLRDAEPAPPAPSAGDTGSRRGTAAPDREAARLRI